MKMVRTPEGSTNPVMQFASLVDPSGVGSSNDCVDRCPRLPPVATVGQPLRGSGVAPNTRPHLRHRVLRAHADMIIF